MDKTIPQGAATTVCAALDPSLESQSGAYLFDCRVELPSEHCQDVDKRVRKEFWEVSRTQLDEALSKGRI